MAKRTDANQAEIVAALRAAGATVQDLHIVGHGCPDLLVGFMWGGVPTLMPTDWGKVPVNVLLEIKTETGRLEPDQTEWHRNWRGQVAVVRSASEALAVIGVQAAPISRFERNTAQAGRRNV